MASLTLPPAIMLLEGEPNLAADAALLEALPHFDSPNLEPALDLLLKRAHPATLGALIAHYSEYDEELRSLITAKTSRLSPGLRLAIVSRDEKVRLLAISMIVETQTTESAYLLADVLVTRCPQTQQAAAIGLNRMITVCLTALKTSLSADQVRSLNIEAVHLATAVSLTLQRWENHRQPSILEAALRMMDRVEPAIRKKLDTGETTFGIALGNWLQRTNDPPMAGALVRALGIPQLQSAAGLAMAHTTDRAFFGAVLAEGWLLTDPRIAQGARNVRHGRPGSEMIGVLFELEGPAMANGLRLLLALCDDTEQQMFILRELLGSDDASVRRTAIRALVRDKSTQAGELLKTAAVRAPDPITWQAACEARHRYANESAAIMVSQPEPRAQATGAAVLLGTAFEKYWTSFDEWSLDERIAASEIIRSQMPDLGVRLRLKIAAPHSLDRVRALRLVMTFDLVAELEADVRRAAHDPDALVRSVAVALLPKAPGASSLRVLRDRTNDPDPRVQANAIEGLERLGSADRGTFTAPKLESPDCRVRANAIKSLLRAEAPEAGEALLDMLGDSLPTHRLSALWVVETMQLRSLGGRVGVLGQDDPDVRVRRRAKRVQSSLGQSAPHRLPPGPRSAGRATPISLTPAGGLT